MSTSLDLRAILIASAVGTVLQVGMVVLGHGNPAIKNYFAVGGMGLSLAAGVLFGLLTGATSLRLLAVGGAMAGGICAFIGILVSYLLADVPATLLLLGTISSVVTGAIGGAGTRVFRG